MKLINNSTADRLLKILALLILLAGVVFRVWVYLEDRNLIIDEANVARNIYERGFVGLAKPLSYEQYAPPIYLWLTKLSTILFGMGELALRLYPFICGLLACYVLYKLIHKLMPVQGLWYPILLFALSPIFIRYSSELKQYMPDVLIALLLIYIALSVNITKYKVGRFVLLWASLGTVAVWASMPSVFILAGVGCYYITQSIQQRRYKFIIWSVVVSAIWLLQFLIYYLLILKPQVSSSYLQNFHHYDFLFATPSSPKEWEHNWKVFSELMRQFEGKYAYVHSINVGFLLAGIIMMVKRNMPLAILFAVPILSLMGAAAFDQYSLMPRVSLFIIPVFIVVVGYGFSELFYLKNMLVKLLLVAFALYGSGCTLSLLKKHTFKYEEIEEGMQFIKDHKLPAAAVSIYHSSIPAFKYYTEMHPDKEQWASLKDADQLQWYINYDSLGWHMQHIWSTRQPLGFIYTNATEMEMKKRDGGIRKHLQLIDSISQPYIHSYIYIKSDTSDTPTR